MKTVSFQDQHGRKFQYRHDEELLRVAKKSTGFEIETIRGSDIATGNWLILQNPVHAHSWSMMHVEQLEWRDPPPVKSIETL